MGPKTLWTEGRCNLTSPHSMLQESAEEEEEEDEEAESSSGSDSDSTDSSDDGNRGATQGCATIQILIVISSFGPNDLQTNKIKFLIFQVSSFFFFQVL